MKIIITIFMSIVVYADTIFIVNANEDESKKSFLKIDGDNCYYKNSYINMKNCYKQTGNIIISSKGKVKEEFLQRYKLKYIREINPQKSTSLYKLTNDSQEIITVVNKINKESSLKARVEWIKPRKLF